MKPIVLLSLFLWCSNLAADSSVEPKVTITVAQLERLLHDNARLRAKITEVGTLVDKCSAMLDKLTDALRKQTDELERQKKLVCS